METNGKAILERYKYLQDLIQTVDAEIEHLRGKIKASSYGGTVTQGGKKSDLSDVVIKIVALEKKYTEQRAEYYDLMLLIVNGINSLPRYEQRLILTDYYISGKTVVQISLSRSYSERQVYNIKSAGISELTKRIK